MTVLAKYQRLEAEGIWRRDAETQRRDVIVSIGDATLTMSDPNEIALSHWSLAAIRRLNPGERPAIYSPGADAPETLEIADPEMIEALGKVLKAIRRQGRRPGRLRRLVVFGTAAVIALATAFWLPGALARYTAKIVPDAARQQAGDQLLSEVRRLTGAPCAEQSGLVALERLSARLFPERPTRLRVVPSALAVTGHIPGGTILIGRQLVEDYESPDVLAGALLAEDLRRTMTDPFERLVRQAGASGALRLLTTGTLGAGDIRAHAEAIIATPPRPVAAEDLADRMARAGLTRSGADIDPVTRTPASLTSDRDILSDSHWIALQQICEG